jgi:hypothetical protein
MLTKLSPETSIIGKKVIYWDSYGWASQVVVFEDMSYRAIKAYCDYGGSESEEIGIEDVELDAGEMEDIERRIDANANPKKP